MTSRIKLSKENADRLAAGKPIKMLRGRVGWNIFGAAKPALIDIHPALHRSEEVEGIRLESAARGAWWHKRLLHIANESGKGTAAMIRTKKVRAQGQRKGVADYFFAVPVAPPCPAHSGWPGLWIELKSATGSPEPDQEVFLFSMQQAGYAVCFAYTADGVLDAIQTYLAGRWPK